MINEIDKGLQCFVFPEKTKENPIQLFAFIFFLYMKSRPFYVLMLTISLIIIGVYYFFLYKQEKLFYSIISIFLILLLYFIVHPVVHEFSHAAVVAFKGKELLKEFWISRRGISVIYVENNQLNPLVLAAPATIQIILLILLVLSLSILNYPFLLDKTKMISNVLLLPITIVLFVDLFIQAFDSNSDLSKLKSIVSNRHKIPVIMISSIICLFRYLLRNSNKGKEQKHV